MYSDSIMGEVVRGLVVMTLFQGALVAVFKFGSPRFVQYFMKVIYAIYVGWLALVVWRWRTTGGWPLSGGDGLLVWGWIVLLYQLFSDGPIATSGPDPRPSTLRWRPINASIRDEREARWAALRRREAEEDERRHGSAPSFDEALKEEGFSEKE